MFRWLWFLHWLAVKLEIQNVRAFSPRPGFKVEVKPNEARVDDFPPTARPYQHLAAVWNEYVASYSDPPYAIFLSVAGKYHGQAIRTVLELACGTGLIARQLAREGYHVVGLDASEDMLREARQRDSNGIEYLQGDFCRFSLGWAFDAIVCVGDSLSYLDGPGRLKDLLECVDRHLRPGGLFFFNAVDGERFLALSRIKMVVSVGQTSFEIHYFYDPVTRVSESRVVFSDSIERHRRIPIEPAEVAQAAALTDLRVLEVIGYGSRFYLLQKAAN